MRIPRQGKIHWRAASFLAVWAMCASLGAQAQQAPNPAEDYRAGKSFIPTTVYTEQEDQKLLELFAGLRVSDVVDGMDVVGLRNVGIMSPDIRPVWKDTEKFTHRFVGIALTARYVPTNRPLPGPMEPEVFDRWSGQWYSKLSPEPFVPLIRKGTALVIEDSEQADVGSIGSNNIMGWKARGCVGVVTSAGARDSDEVAIERIPLYFKRPGRGIRPGRNQIESVNRPVVVGGVLVMPGDVIVADGDGVVVVPRAQAEQVARYARRVLEADKAGRRKLYEKLGLPPDDSVR